MHFSLRIHMHIVTGALMPSAGMVTSSTVQGLPVATATLAQPATNPSVVWAGVAEPRGAGSQLDHRRVG